MIKIFLLLFFMINLFSFDKLPPIHKKKTISSLSTINIKYFQFIGNNKISDEELQKVIYKYENRVITAEELQEVRVLITKYYIKKGYISSGAIIPQQSINDGVIKIKIIEGVLSKITLSNDGRLSKNYILDRLEIDKNKIVDINKIQNKLKLLKENRRIKNIKAELKPDIEFGKASLNLVVKEENPLNINLITNNHKSQSIGSNYTEMEIEHINVTGLGDTINLKYGITKGIDTYSVLYSHPLTKKLDIKLSTSKTDSNVVLKPFDLLDITSKIKSKSIGFNYSLYKNRLKDLSLSINLETRESETSLLGETFAFSKGAKGGEYKISALEMSQEYISKTISEVLVARSTFRVGLNILDSSISDEKDEPDSDFLTWLGQFHLIRKIDLLDSQLQFKGSIFLSTKPLLPAEKFSMGGDATVKGYHESLITTDNAILASAKWIIPVGKLKIPYLASKKDDGLFKVAPFINFGKGKNYNGDYTKTLYSAGLGLLWNVNQNIYTELYLTKAFNKEIVKNKKYDLQDDGIHFQIKYKLF